MRRRLLCALVLAGAAIPAAPVLGQHPAAGAGHGPRVEIGYDHVTPADIDVVAGDPVEWVNTSARNHTVTADDRSFDSGVIASGDEYQRSFASEGVIPYHCRLHPTIRGSISVHRLLLVAPAHPAAPNRAFPLAGRAALPTGSEITIEADTGSGFAAVAHAAVDDAGGFTATVTPSEGGTYRAVAGDVVSPPVELLVLDRSVTVSVTRRGRTSVVAVHVAPASPGDPVVLSYRLRERFGWWPIAHRKLDANSNARFVVRRHERVSARISLTLPDLATVLARSRTVHVGARR